MVDIITGASYDAAAEEAYRKQQHEEEERRRREETVLLAKQLKEREKQEQIEKLQELEKSFQDEMDRLIKMVQQLNAKEISRLKNEDKEPCKGAQAAMMAVLSLLGHPSEDFASWGKSTYQIAKTGKYSLKFRMGTFDMKLVNPTVISDVLMYSRPVEDEELLMKQCLPIGTFYKWARGILALYPKYKEMVVAQRAAKGLPPEEEIAVKSLKKNVLGSVFSKKVKGKLNALVKLGIAEKKITDPTVGENTTTLKKVVDSSIDKKAAAPLASLAGLGASLPDNEPEASAASSSEEDEDLTGKEQKEKEEKAKKKKNKNDKKKEKKQRKKDKKAQEAAQLEAHKLKLPGAEELEQQSLQMSVGQPASERKVEKEKEEDTPSSLSSRESVFKSTKGSKLKTTPEPEKKKNFKALWKMPLMAQKFKARAAFGTPRAAGT